MTTIKLRLNGTVARQSEAAAKVRAPGDAVIVERGVVRGIVLACPCGCGETLPINLDPRAGAAWRLYRRRRDGLTLYPSVWRESGCRSHFIIWRDKILLFSSVEENIEESGQPQEVINALAESVVKILPQGRVVSFIDLAEHLQEIPWDVLLACRQLVRSGRAREGRGAELAHFGKGGPSK